MNIIEIIDKLEKLNAGLEVVDNQLRIKAEKGSLSQDLLMQIRENKESLIEYIVKINFEKDEYIEIKKAEEREYYPTTSAQKRIYLLKQLDKGNKSSNLTGVFEVKNGDVFKIEKIFKKLIERHEAFRTAFEIKNEELVQKIYSKVDFKINKLFCDEKDLEFNIQKTIKDFDLKVPPLINVSLIETKKKLILIVDVDHIILDAMSMNILSEEFLKLYKEEELDELKIQYKDYAVWQSGEEIKEEIENKKKYWIEKFQDYTSDSKLPLDYRRYDADMSKGGSLNLSIDKNMFFKVKDIIKKSQVTTFTFVLAVYNLFLYKISGSKDIVVGAPVLGRNNENVKNMVGILANVLPLKNEINTEEKFGIFLKNIHKNNMKDFSNQDYNFEDLLRELNIKREKNRSQLFDTVFNGMNGIFKEEIRESEDILLIPYNYERDTSISDIMVLFNETNDSVEINFTYKTGLFKRSTMESLINGFKELIEQIVENPDKKISEYSMLLLEDKKVMKNANEISILDCFEKTVKENSNKLALDHMGSKASYAELDIKTNSIAANIQDMKSDSSIVSILLGHNGKVVESILGTLKAGKTFVSLDPSYPVERLEYILNDTDTKVILTDNENIDLANELCKLKDMKILNIESLDKNLSYEKVDVSAEDLAYMIYTSGSTGKPKGVMQQHKNAVRFMEEFNRKLDINGNDRFAVVSSFSHQMGVMGILSMLLTGGRIYTYDVKDGSMKDFIDFISENEISIYHSVPTLYRNMLMELDSKEEVESIRRVVLGGEAVSRKDVNLYKDNFTDSCKLANVFGSTEVAIATMNIVDKNTEVNKDTLYSGYSSDDVEVRVLNDSGNVCGAYEIGEIVYEGYYISPGYLNLEEETKEKFKHYADGKVRYSSGDLGRWHRDGNLEYLGRKDNQLKIRGFRVELGEIESQLEKYEGIEKAVVVGRDDKDGNKYLVGYYRSLEELKISDLRNHISKDLPDYMVPSYFMRLEEFPVTGSGKLDRNALPEPDGSINTGIEYEAASTETEEKLVKVWEDLLGVERVGVNDNFFDLGGHSLKATILASRIHKELNVKLNLQEIFEYQTVKEQGKYILSLEKDEYIEIKRAEEKDYYPLSSAQKRMYILNQLNKESINYNVSSIMKIEGNLDKERLKQTFKELVKRHEVFRTSFDLEDGVPVQKISNDIEFEIKYIKSKEEDIETLIKSFRKPFNLTKAPLLRVELLELSDEENMLMIDMHHIISDGTSINILTKEFSEIYGNGDLEEMKLQYKDYAVWEDEQIEKGELKKQEEHWENVFEDSIPTLSFPIDNYRPAVQSFEGGTYGFDISEAQFERIKKFCEKNGVTENMFLYSVYLLLVSKYSSQEDIVLGSIVAGKNHIDLENVIGMFANFLPIRNRLKEDMTFKELMDISKENLLSSYNNQNYPFEKIVEKADRRNDRSRNPMFDTMMVYHNEFEDGNELVLGELKLKPYELEGTAATIDLKLDIFLNESGYSCLFEYASKLFKKESIEKISSKFIELLEKVLDNSNTSISEISIFDAKEYEEIKAKRKLNRVKPNIEKEQVLVSASFTSEPIKESMEWWSSKFKVDVEVDFAPYNQIFQQLLDEGSELSQNTGINLILLRFEDLIRSSQKTVSEQVELLKDNYKEIVEIIRNKNLKVPYFIGVFPVSSHLNLAEELISCIKDINEKWLNDLKGINNVYPIDLRTIVNLYQIKDIFDEIKDKEGHMPFSDEYYVGMGTFIARKICSLKQNKYKVIVLDCDNTLWGDVVGEVGVDGIELSGAYEYLQNFMIEKHNEGVLLALCSKNNENDVLEVFEKNEKMKLKKDHLVSWKINWEAKSQNIIELANELNLGLDSFIFIDDNPMEIEEVRENAKEVLSLKLPKDPSKIENYLNHIWAFDKLNVTKEDKKRTKMYQAEQERTKIKKDVNSLEDFIKKLNLKILIEDINEEQIPRVSQLSQRTNQFNSTTIRRTESELKLLLEDKKVRCLTIDVSDRFGEYGLVGGVITRELEKNLVIESFMMSCRVLGRRVEDEILIYLRKYCENKGLEKIVIDYISSEKNMPFLKFIERMGAKEKGKEAGILKYELMLEEIELKDYIQEEKREEVSSKKEKISKTSQEKEEMILSYLYASDIDSIDKLMSINMKQKIKNISKVDYEAPSNEVEEKIRSLWQKILKLDRIGVNDNFFEIGGHSLNAVLLIAEMNKFLPVKYDEIFKYETIREQGKYIGENYYQNQIRNIKVEFIKVEEENIKIISEIVENKDEYSWSVIDCFLKPMAMLHDSYKEGLFDIFLFYTKFFNNYLVDDIFKNVMEVEKVPNKSFFDFHNLILKDKLGFEFSNVKFENEKDMVENLQRELKKGKRILVPIDLYNLHYYQDYKKENHPHYFIIKGYDKVRELFYILDYTHVDGGGGTKFKDFTIENSKLYELSKDYYKNLFNKDEFYFWSLGKKKNINIGVQDVVKDIIDYFTRIEQGIIKIKYLEYELLKYWESRNHYRIELIVHQLIMQLNSKFVYYDILFKFLDKVGVEPKDIDDVRKYQNNISEEWNKVRHEILDNMARGVYYLDKIEIKIKENIKKEEIFRKRILNLCLDKDIKDSLENLREKSENRHEFIEKNLNNAIINRSDNRYEIFHSDEKTYDTWLLEDKAVQFLLENEKKDNMEFEFKFESDSPKDSWFMAGIILRLNGSKIMYGISGNNGIVVLSPENSKIRKIENIKIPVGGIYLKVKKVNDKYKFFNRGNLGEQWKQYLELDLGEDPVYYGLFSRTWEKMKHKSIFSELKYK